MLGASKLFLKKKYAYYSKYGEKFKNDRKIVKNDDFCQCQHWWALCHIVVNYSFDITNWYRFIFEPKLRQNYFVTKK